MTWIEHTTRFVNKNAKKTEQTKSKWIGVKQNNNIEIINDLLKEGVGGEELKKKKTKNDGSLHKTKQDHRKGVYHGKGML